MTGFENWATSPRSVVEMDPTLAFESQLLKDALAAWLAQAGDGVPPRSAFTPRTVKDFLGHLVILERLEPSRYLVRLMGTRVTAVIGEMQGELVNDAVPPDVAERWTLALNQVLATRRPCRFVNRVGFSNLDFLQAEILLAPLRDKRGETTMVFAVVAFRSGVAAGPKIDTIIAEGDDAMQHEDKGQ